MKMIKIALLSLGALLFVVTIASPLRASDWDRSVSVTFDSSVAIPGQVLPAGTYVFKTLNDTFENMVQIWNADQAQVVATVPVVPDQLARSYNETVFYIDHNGPVAKLDSWFYPGDNVGYQFDYTHQNTER